MEIPRFSFTVHALDQMRERGIAEHEIVSTIETGDHVGLPGNRAIRKRVFTEGYTWHGRDYPHKEVKVIYAMEGDSVIVITAIARYGHWEDAQ